MESGDRELKMEERRNPKCRGRRMSDIEQPCPIYHEINAKLQATCRKIEDLEKLFNIVNLSQKEALTLAREDMERRALGWNELRSELKDFRDYAASKERLDELIKEWIRWRENHLEETGLWRSDITKRLTVIETRAITWTAAIGIIIVIINIVMRWWK